METIIAALISGIATVVAAWISRKERRRESAVAPAKLEKGEEKVDSSGHRSNTDWWLAVMGLLMLLIIFAGFFIHHDLPFQIGLFGIPVVVIILAFIKPTRPWNAAAFVFGVSTIAFLTEFAVKLSRGDSIALSPNDRGLPLWILLFSAGYAVLGAVICWWRNKKGEKTK